MLKYNCIYCLLVNVILSWDSLSFGFHLTDDFKQLLCSHWLTLCDRIRESFDFFFNSDLNYLVVSVCMYTHA